jgi:hypothetical protein
LETKSADFYEQLASRFEESGDAFLGFARENRKFITQIERAYYGVITDAIEGCFAFDLDPNSFRVKTVLPEKISYPNALTRALQIEAKIVNYYRIAAEQSKHLMADVPRSFTLVAKKRSECITKIEGLVGH